MLKSSKQFLSLVGQPIVDLRDVYKIEEFDYSYPQGIHKHIYGIIFHRETFRSDTNASNGLRVEWTFKKKEVRHNVYKYLMSNITTNINPGDIEGLDILDEKDLFETQ